MDYKYPHLFSPLRVKDKVLKNRIITGPSNHCLQGKEDFPTEQSMVYYASKAKGGAAMVYPGSVRVDPGLYDPRCSLQEIWNQFNPYDRYAWRYFKQNTDIIHHFGALAGIEFHQMPFGGYNVSDMKWRTIFAVSRQERQDGMIAEEMPEYEMEKLAEAYAEATAICKHLGYDCVIVHGGHGMQMAQFLSPRYNKRTDKYGGSLENRARYPLMVLRKIREKVGDGILIDFRISADEGSGAVPGFSSDECLGFLTMAEPYIDFAHISAGDTSNTTFTPYLDGSFFGRDCVYSHLAAKIKKSGRLNIPVLSVGAYRHPKDMEQMLAEGNCDGIVIARGLIADPELPNKAKRGHSEDIRPCIKCNNCLDDHRQNHFFSCTVNPRIGREHHFPYIIDPNPELKKVVVIGGGPAGMQAALTAAERGHDVTLLDKNDRLGGTLNFSEHFPTKFRIKEYIDYMAVQLEKNGVKVCLNTVATPESVKAMNADAVICAIGAEPVIPNIPGVDGKNVITAAEVYGNLDKIGGKIVIVGGGEVGCETGIYLGRAGKKVTLLEMTSALLPNAFKNMKAPYRYYMAETMETRVNARCTGISDMGVTYANADGAEHFVEADTIVLAAGLKPRIDESESFRFCACDFRPVGDCEISRNIKFAVRTGFDAAAQL